MTMQTAISGVRIGDLARHADARGSFRELWRSSSFAGERFLQANMSTSSPGVLRGLHVHRSQADYWVVNRGRAFVALVDLRSAFQGDAMPIISTLEMRTDQWCYIPAGVAHGFLALEEFEMLYLVTNEYDGSDELGIAWDDESLAIHWPIPRGREGWPLLSPRDRVNPTFRTMLMQRGSTNPENP